MENEANLMHEALNFSDAVHDAILKGREAIHDPAANDRLQEAI